MKILFFANTEWYLYNFRRSLMLAARDAGYDVIMVSPPGPYVEKLQALGLRWIAAPLERRSLNPVKELSAINWLRKLIIAEQIDLVHGFTIKCAVYGAIAARLAGNRARVSAITGLGYVFISNDLKARLLRPIVRNIFCFALHGEKTRLIVENSDDLVFFQQTGLIEPSRIRLIRSSGVDCSRFSQCAIRTANEPLRILLAARLLWDKGIKEYVEAARILKAQGRTIHFLLAGSPDPGNPNTVSEPIVKDWVREGLIEWLGHVNDMPALFATIHAFVLPSYREGVPTSLIEAAACGITLITTDAPGCREVVTHEVDGLLVPMKDAEALAAAIARIDDDSALAAKLSKAAKTKALSTFDEKIVIQQTMAVYQELL
ncbi:MAG: glycosyltransferase family 4 protein [Nitrosomonas sp.]